ncbi:MAG: hypothetical protein WCV00_14060 [Verrucomicrobiia bacterium]|jgi:hypothetical protein
MAKTVRRAEILTGAVDVLLTAGLLRAQEPLFEKQPSLHQTMLGTRARLQQRQSARQDANAHYYGSCFGRRNITYRDRPDFLPVLTLESAMGMPPASQ